MNARSESSLFASLLNAPLRVIALRNSDDVSIASSASGGAFVVLAHAMLNRGGVVFGAALLESGRVEHVCAKNISELRALQGSKYVRSDVADTYGECYDYLSRGVDVLYSGTPCQIAALRSYLKKRNVANLPGSLVCVDLICHGTPGQEIFKAYISWLSAIERTDDGIHGYEFRNKLMGWGLYYYYYYYYRSGKRHEKLGQASDDPYYSAFAKGIIYRKCCYNCPFARIERAGDFTVGDFWGIEDCHPDFYDERGVSAVLINSIEANEFFNDYCIDKCEWIDSTVENVIARNGNLTGPTKRTEEQEQLAKEVEKAVADGDYDKAFGVLLKPRLSVTARIRRLLPWKAVRFLYTLRR